MNERQLLDIRKKIEGAQQDLSERKAEQKILIEKIKKELQADSLDECYEKIKEIEKDLEAKVKRREKLMEKLEEMLSYYED